MSDSPDPISEKCKLVLAKGPVCKDGYKVFTGQRRYALCRAFDLIEKGKEKSFGDALKKSWIEIHDTCLFETLEV